MTCKHVLGLIDAGPFADYPRAHLAAAWQHVRECATCGPALQASTALTTDLAALPLVAPPPDLARSVMARIAQIDQAHSVRDAAKPETTTGFSTSHWSAWATTLGGLAAGVAIVFSTRGNGILIDIAGPRVGVMTDGLVAMPSTTPDALVLAAGLGLYVAGLFAPLGGGSAQHAPARTRSSD